MKWEKKTNKKKLGIKKQTKSPFSAPCKKITSTHAIMATIEIDDVPGSIGQQLRYVFSAVQKSFQQN